MKVLLNAILVVGMLSGSAALAGSDHKHKKGDKHKTEAAKTCEKCKKSEKDCTCDEHTEEHKEEPKTK